MCAVRCVRHSAGPAWVAVPVRPDVNDVGAGLLWRAAGARTFAQNWAGAQVEVNADQWAVEATCGIAKADRVRPLTYVALAQLWTAAKPTVVPWQASTRRGRSGTA